jgi:hypothetical protein
MAIRIIRNVPADRVDAVERMFIDSGATSVSRAREEDDEFTVTAVFPDIERHADLEARLNDGASTI